MPLKSFINSLDEVDEAFRSVYREDGDGFALDIEDRIENHPQGRVMKLTLDKERNQRKAHDKRIAELEALAMAYKGIDPAKARELLDQQEQLENQELIKKGDFETLIARRESKLKADYEDQLKQATDKLAALEASLSARRMGDEVTKAAQELGVLPEKMKYLLPLVKEAGFQVADDGIFAYDAEGKRLANGVNPLSIRDWMQELVGNDPDFLGQSRGGGLSNTGHNSGRDFRNTEEYKSRSVNSRLGDFLRDAASNGQI